MSVSRDKNGTWQYNFMYLGRRYHRRFSNASYEEVKGYEAIAKSELVQRRYDITSSKEYTLKELIDDYKIYRENNYTRPKEFDYVIDKFFNMTGNKFANDISLQDIEKYRNSRIGKVSNSSINRETDNIKKLFSLAYDNHKIKENPCSKLVDLRIKNPPERYLTAEEEKKLLEVANPILKAMIILAINTGIRQSELLNLKWQDVFFDKGYLIVLNSKNKKSRKLLLSKTVQDELKQIPRLSEYVFTNPMTKTKYVDIKTTFKRAVDKAGIPHITFHKLRHTTATRLNEKGVDIATIQEILDHADISTTRKYVHSTRKNLVEAMKVLEDYTQ